MKNISILSLTGVYKSQEARLMLHIYLIKGPSHTTVSKMKEEKWAMDGFVSIFLLIQDHFKYVVMFVC